MAAPNDYFHHQLINVSDRGHLTFKNIKNVFFFLIVNTDASICKHFTVVAVWGVAAFYYFRYSYLV